MCAMFGWLWPRPRNPQGPRPPLWMRTEKLEEEVARMKQEREASAAERAEAKKLESLKKAALEELEKKYGLEALQPKQRVVSGSKRPLAEEFPGWNMVELPTTKRRVVINASAMEDAFKEVAMKAPYPQGLYNATNLVRQILERSDFKLAKWRTLASKLLDDVPQDKDEMVNAVVTAFAK